MIDVTFSHDSRFLHTTSGTDFSTFHLFSIPDGKQLFAKDWQSSSRIFPAPEAPHFILTGQDPWFTIWDPLLEIPNRGRNEDPVPPPKGFSNRVFQGGTPVFQFGHASRVVTGIAPPGTDYYLSASSDGTLRRWSLAPHKPAFPHGDLILNGHDIWHPIASQDGSFVLFAGKAAPGYLWHRPSDEVIRIPEEHTHLGVLNDGRFFTRARATSEVFAWQFTPGEPPQELWRKNPGPTIPGFPNMIHASVSKGERFITVLFPGCALWIDTTTGECKSQHDQVMVYGTTPGQTIAVSPDGSLTAVTGFAGNAANLYKPSAFSQKLPLLPARPYSTKDSACAFSPDGEKLYVANCDGWVRVFDPATRKELPAEGWRAHSNEVTALAVSQNGEIIATAAGHSLTLWSAETEEGKPRRQRLLIETGLPSRNWIQFVDDDGLLMHSAPRNPIEVWETR